MKRLLLIALLFLSACSVTEWQQVSELAYEAKQGFTYVDQGLDFPPKVVDCKSYSGNCNDYAVCLKQLMEGAGFEGVELKVCKRYGVPHMVVMYKDYLMDNYNDEAIDEYARGYECGN